MISKISYSHIYIRDNHDIIYIIFV